MKRRKIVSLVLIAAMLVSGTTMISGAEANETEERIWETVQVASDSNASLPKDDVVDEVIDEAVDEVIENDIELLIATPSDAVYVSTEEELKTAVKTSGTVVVEGEIQLSERLDIEGDINLDITGGCISYSGLGRQMIQIKGAEVSFSDITIDATGMDCHDTNNGRLRDYYAIQSFDNNTKIIIGEGTNIICEDKENSPINPRKRAVWIAGEGVMDGGRISGFGDVGIVVGKEATFVLKDGELSENGWHKTDEWSGTGGLVVTDKGKAYIEGGSIHSNQIGIFNNGYVSMAGGEVVKNSEGFINNNEDGITHQEFSPIAEISGGMISGNKRRAITNRTRGKITISGDAVIEGAIISEMQDQVMAKRSASNSKQVIRNEESATLNIAGGTILANAEGEIAISNDGTGKINMTAGEVIAAGEKTVAIQNENTKVGDVSISGGEIQSTGTGSSAIDNLNGGYMEITEDVTINTGDKEQYLIAVTHTDGGKISPSTQMADVGQKINITVTENSGYKITDVTVDGVSIGAVRYYELTVSNNHSITATFEEKPSSGGSSGGGGGGSSSGSSKISAASAPSIPETAGSWIQNETGWKFTKPDGSAYVNTWIRKSNQWYWIGADSYMLQGWNQINDAWYYLMPVSGEMKTGWLNDNGSWYFLDKDGKKAVNTTTPDGYKVDSNGVWIN